MNLVQMGTMTLNLDRVAVMLDSPGLEIRVIMEDGHELTIVDPADVAALRAWIGSHSVRLV